MPLQRYRCGARRMAAVAAELVERRDGARRLAQEADLLRHGLTEIEAVDPQPGEDDELTEEARRLAAADDLREAAGTARAAIAGGVAMDAAPPAAALARRRGPPPARRARRRRAHLPGHRPR